jgi:hypothetical protein
VLDFNSLTLVSFHVIIGEIMALFYRLPQLTLLAALVVFTLLLVLMVTSGSGLAQPINLVLLVLLAVTIVLLFLAQNPNNENAALMLWFGAGVWSAAAYLNFQMLGLFALIVAALSAVSAFWVERESRTFSFTGPALFIGVALSLVIIANLLAR